MRVLALDVARKTGWAVDGASTVAPDYAPLVGTYVLSWGGDYPGRAGEQFWRFLDRMVLKHKPDLLVVEAPAYGGGDDFVMNAKTTLLLVGLVFLAFTVGAFHRVTVEQAVPQTWRKHFLGHGRPKEPKRVALAHCRRLGWTPRNGDEADACGLWHYGKRHDKSFAVTATPLFMP